MQIHVSVAPKRPPHPTLQTGSPNGYVIDGVSGKTLQIPRGTEVSFQLDTPGHPFYLTTDPVGGQGAPGALTESKESGELKVTFDSQMPEKLYYQCAVHPSMGASIEVIESNTGKKGTVKSVGSAKSTGSVRSEKGFETVLEVPGPVFAIPDARFNSVGNRMPVTPATLIGTQSGKIFRVAPGSEDTLVADLSDRIPKLNPGYDERGLLGAGVFKGKLYLFYSMDFDPARTTQRKTRVERAENPVGRDRLSSFPYIQGEIDLGAEEVLLEIERTGTIHHGGPMVISDSGMLFLGVGDGGPQEDPENRGQRMDTMQGKILRLDLIQKDPVGFTAIPRDNPFPNALTPEIYALGFRNPWGLTLGKFRGQDTLVVADVGYNSWEEINLVRKGRNYGWNLFEGSRKTSWTREGDEKGPGVIENPVYEYATHQNFPGTSVETSAVVGVQQLPGGNFLIADFSGVGAVLEPTGIEWTLKQSFPLEKYIRALGRDGQGRVLILRSDGVGPNSPGEVLRYL